MNTLLVSTQAKKRYLTVEVLQQLTEKEDPKNVTLLDLTTKFTNEKFQVIENLDIYCNLTSLDLSNNEFMDIRGLSKLSKLRSLVADNNKINSLSGLSELKNLVSLSLKNNCLERLPKKNVWESLEYLDSLDISYNSLSVVNDLQRLSSNNNLKQLCIEGNPITQNEQTSNYALFWIPSLKELDHLEINETRRESASAKFMNISIGRELQERDDKIDSLSSTNTKLKEELESHKIQLEQTIRKNESIVAELKQARQELGTKSHLLDMTAAARFQLLEELNNTKLELENMKMGFGVEQPDVKLRTEDLKNELRLLEQNKIEYEQKLEEYRIEIDRLIVPKAINDITEREIQALNQQNAEEREKHQQRLLEVIGEVKKLTEDKQDLELQLQETIENRRIEEEERSSREADLLSIQTQIEKMVIEEIELKTRIDHCKTELMNEEAAKRLVINQTTQLKIQLESTKLSVEKEQESLRNRLEQCRAELMHEESLKQNLANQIAELNHQLSTMKSLSKNEEEELAVKRSILQNRIHQAEQQLVKYQEILNEESETEYQWKKKLIDTVSRMKNNSRDSCPQQMLFQIDDSVELVISHRRQIENSERKMTELQSRLVSLETERDGFLSLKQKLEESQQLYESQTASVNEKLHSERSLYKQNIQQLQDIFSQKEQDLRSQIEQLKSVNIKLQREQELALSLAQQSRLEQTTEYSFNNSNVSNASSELYDQLKHEISHLSQQRQDSMLTHRLKNQVKEQKAQIEFLINQNEHMKKQTKRQETMLHNSELLQKVNQNVEWIVAQMKNQRNNERGNVTPNLGAKAVQTEETPHNNTAYSPFKDEQKRTNKSPAANRLILSFLDTSSAQGTGDNRIIEISEEQSVNDRIGMLLNWVASTKNILKHTHTLMDDLSQQSQSEADVLDDNKRRKLKKLLSKFSPSKARQYHRPSAQINEYN